VAATRKSSILPILVALIVSAVAPVILAGFWNLWAAETAAAAGHDAEASQHYELAARQLFWRTDLRESAGLSAYRSGDYDGTIHLLRPTMPRQALSPRGWDALGSAYWATGDRVSAIAAWKTGARLNPRDPLFLDRLASAYRELKDFASERDALAQRLRLSDDAPAHYRFGLLLMEADPARAGRELNAAAADANFAPAAATLLAALKAAAAATSVANQLLSIGRGLGLVEEWELAAAALERAVEADANNAEAWAWLGEARQHTGQDGQLELDRALLLGPGNPLIHVLRGLRWRRQGNASAAVNEYSRAVEIEPDNPVLRSALGEAYAAAGDLVAALTAYQAATALAPADAAYWRILAAFCADNGVQLVEIGLPAAQKADALRPRDAQTLDTLAWTYAQAGYAEKAEQTALQAIRLAPELALAHLHLAQIYLASGREAMALKQLTTTRDLDPNGSAGKMAAALLSKYFP
jgi:tetratricopeptide (TPR) repeat protein